MSSRSLMTALLHGNVLPFADNKRALRYATCRRTDRVTSIAYKQTALSYALHWLSTRPTLICGASVRTLRTVRFLLCASTGRYCFPVRHIALPDRQPPMVILECQLTQHQYIDTMADGSYVGGGGVCKAQVLRTNAADTCHRASTHDWPMSSRAQLSLSFSPSVVR